MTGDAFLKPAELACLDPAASIYAGDWGWNEED